VLKLVNTPFEKKPQFAVKSNKNVIKLFNTTFLTKNQSDSKAPRALRLHSDLLGFQKFYNQHGDIDYSVLRYGKIREKPGIYYCCISIYKFPRTKTRNYGNNYGFFSKGVLTNFNTFLLDVTAKCGLF
jgi:hypothetical protein